MKIRKEIIGHELFLYADDQLIYKRWLDQGYSKVFDVMAYDKYTLASYSELEFERDNQLIQVRAKLTMKATKEGGRQTGFISGYRPNHVFEYPENDQLLQTYIGDIQFEGESIFESGETRDVVVRFMWTQKIEKYLHLGRVWWIHEGLRCLGEAEILEFV